MQKVLKVPDNSTQVSTKLECYVSRLVCKAGNQFYFIIGQYCSTRILPIVSKIIIQNLENESSESKFEFDS